MSIASELVAGGITGIFKSLTTAAQVFKADATQGAQLDAALEEAKLNLIALAIQADSKSMESVNAAIAAEAAAKQEHWVQWLWRPLNGLVLAFGSGVTVLFTIYAGYMAINGKPEALTALPAIITAMATVLAVPGAVCGVTAWFRGTAQVETAKK